MDITGTGSLNETSMDDSYLILFGIGLGLLAFLISLLVSFRDPSRKKRVTEKRGKCPLCGTELAKGYRISSNVTEIGNIEIQTWIKGCPYCMGSTGRRKRTCPVCRKKVKKDEMIIAISDPKVDRKKLSIRGCRQCYPQAF